MKNIDIKLLDKRTVRRYLEQGLLKQEEYKKYLESLVDDASDMTTMNLEELDLPVEPANTEA